MARIVFTDAADLDSTFIYADLYAKAGKHTVVKYRGLFNSVYARLTLFPDSGAPRPELGPNIRIGVVSPYIVIHRHNEADDTVIILRIVFGSSSITSKLIPVNPHAS